MEFKVIQDQVHFPLCFHQKMCLKYITVSSVITYFQGLTDLVSYNRSTLRVLLKNTDISQVTKLYYHLFNSICCWALLPFFEVEEKDSNAFLETKLEKLGH